MILVALSPANRPKRTTDTGDVVDCLHAVPLSASDRQLLTDARVARGWSQTELARRINSSLPSIHTLEVGTRSPSPEYLSRLCKALGLEWQCEFRLWIAPKNGKRSGRRA